MYITACVENRNWSCLLCVNIQRTAGKAFSIILMIIRSPCLHLLQGYESKISSPTIYDTYLKKTLFNNLVGRIANIFFSLHFNRSSLDKDTGINKLEKCSIWRRLSFAHSSFCHWKHSTRITVPSYYLVGFFQASSDLHFTEFFVLLYIFSRNLSEFDGTHIQKKHSVSLREEDDIVVTFCSCIAVYWTMGKKKLTEKED